MGQEEEKEGGNGFLDRGEVGKEEREGEVGREEREE